MTDVVVVSDDGNTVVIDLVDADPPAIIDVTVDNSPPAVIEVDMTHGGGGGGGGAPISTDPRNLIKSGTDGGILYDSADSFGQKTAARLFPDPVNDQFLNITVVNNGTDPATWPERIRFNYDPGTARGPRRTGFFNENGEIRACAAKLSGDAARFYGKEFNGDGLRDTSIPILEVSDDRDNRTSLFGMYSDGRLKISGIIEGGASASIVGAVAAGSVAATGTVTGSNIGNAKVSQGPVPPSSPAVGDCWVDTN